MKLWCRAFRGLTLAGVVLGGVILGSAAISIAGAGRAAAQTAATITVEGNRRVEADTIRSYFRLAPGERLDASKIDEGLKALYATGLFQDVRITPAGGRIIVTVVEAPVINRVVHTLPGPIPILTISAAPEMSNSWTMSGVATLPAMMVSVPSSALGEEPVTGASTRCTEGSAAAISRVAVGPIVEQSTHSTPGSGLAATPVLALR